jgi:broad specificity phosphatase PhoE
MIISGKEQAFDAGKKIASYLTRVKSHVIQAIVSPYKRAMQTFDCIESELRSFQQSVREDVRLRELDHGNVDIQDNSVLTDTAHKMKKENIKKKGGSWYYR